MNRSHNQAVSFLRLTNYEIECSQIISLSKFTKSLTILYFSFQYCLSGSDRSLRIWVRVLLGLPAVVTIVATATLDARTYFIIQSRNIKRFTKSQQHLKLLQNCASRTSAAANRNLAIPINSTVISTTLSIICNAMFVAANVSTIPSFYVVINSAIVVNSLRVPMIILFAFKENKSTIYRSRVKRQEWEQQNALQEKQKRIQFRQNREAFTHDVRFLGR